MSESYVGTKFKTEFTNRCAPVDKRIDALIHWGTKFSEMEIAPATGGDGAGNLSFRSDNGFIITNTGTILGKLTQLDFCLVQNVDIPAGIIRVTGCGEPSSECFIHQSIYSHRPDVNAIFHGHHEAMLKYTRKLHLPITVREQPYGTSALQAEVMSVLNQHKFILIKNHGFLSLGNDIDTAGNQVMEIIHRLSRF